MKRLELTSEQVTGVSYTVDVFFIAITDTSGCTSCLKVKRWPTYKVNGHLQQSEPQKLVPW